MEKEKTTLFRPLAKLGKTLPKAAGFLVPMTRCACLIFLYFLRMGAEILPTAVTFCSLNLTLEPAIKMNTNITTSRL